MRDGTRVDAVAQATKSGHVFVFNRETGEPLFPIEERQVPPSDLDGEQTWPTQPIPVSPPAFSRQRLTEGDLTERTPEARAAVLKTFRAVRSNGQFVPPSTQGTVIFPGFDGGAEWGGQAFDEKSGRLFVNANEMPWILTMVPVKTTGGAGERLYQVNCAVCHGAERKGAPAQMVPTLIGIDRKLTRAAAADIIRAGKGVMPAFAALPAAQRDAIVGFLFGEMSRKTPADDEEPDPSVKYSHTGYNRFLDPDGYPAVRPPWGTLNAIDLTAGTIAWSVPLGELPELTAQGHPADGHGELRRPGDHGDRRCSSSRPRRTRSSGPSTSPRDAPCGRRRCRQADTRRLRSTPSAASRSSSSPRAAERWARSRATPTSPTRCPD